MTTITTRQYDVAREIADLIEARSPRVLLAVNMDTDLVGVGEDDEALAVTVRIRSASTRPVTLDELGEILTGCPGVQSWGSSSPERRPDDARFVILTEPDLDPARVRLFRRNPENVA